MASYSVGWGHVGYLLFCAIFSFLVVATHGGDQQLLVLTVATEETDGFRRFVSSASRFNLNVQVLGLGEDWTGGDVKHYTGGGQKVRLLRNTLKQLEQTRPNLIVLFSDSYDVVINGEMSEILKRFQKFEANVLFSAEGYCWPDKSLAIKYPIVKSGKRYLNSGLFMGYAKDLYKIVSHSDIKDGDDDQLYYTRLFLNENFRKEINMKLDHTSEIFQNLNGAKDDIDLDFSKSDNPEVVNLAYGTRPLIIHGNGASKDYLNYLGNYIGRAWSNKDGCISCKEGVVTLAETQDASLPLITLAVFIERPTPFLEEFFEKIAALKYPKSKMHLFLHTKETYHSQIVLDFTSKFGNDYRSQMILLPKDSVDERTVRTQAVDFCLQKMCEFLFVVESEVHLSNPSVITSLMERTRDIVAPMVARPGKLWANFWGTLSADGFYERSDDYVQLVHRERKGLWNVPHIASSYLIHAEKLTDLRNAYNYDKRLDPDMSFTKYCRDKGYFMYLDNLELYGYLINSDDFDTSLTHPEMYQIFDNKLDWERKYLHKDYYEALNETYKAEMPCPDVYWLPTFSPTFCKHLINIMEAFGKWSSGNNEDTRLAGGYENVPTRDIHMNQVGLERHWLYILDQYIRPLQEKVFIGYFHRPPNAVMNFVVRYKPDEQPFLRPHHDASTYTLNMALNLPGVDYEGGGARFIRYNCSVVDFRLGWALLHPGRLTHYHEGLPTTKGTRYIMISFIDP